MQVVDDLAKRIANMYEVLSPLSTTMACNWFELGKWGIVKNQNNMEVLKDLSVLYLIFAMLEWKTWEQNTFYLELDDNDCPKWKYPGDIIDQKTLKCLIDHFLCNKIDIRNALKKYGILDPGVKPDGIDYMHIEIGTPPCDNRIFQIEKPYGNDFV